MDKNVDLSAKIEEGFGPNGLGILLISDVPELACLPEDVKKELEDPNSRYNFGWNILKGSFYANPIFDTPTTDESLVQRTHHIVDKIYGLIGLFQNLKWAFKALGKLILDIGLMVAYHCDRYVSRGMKMHEDEGLEQILLRSRCHKGIAMEEIEDEFLMGHKVKEIKKAGRWHENVFTQNGESMSSWCGWHTDHGSLTGLTCGMLMRDAVELPCPDSAAGLYIKTRNDQIVKVVFGEDEIAYQVGETTEILSRGHLCATPHCVRAPKGEEASGIERSTFALFMQPDWYGIGIKRLIFLRWSISIRRNKLISSYGSLTFGVYTEKLLDKYYHLKA
ncbi:unnamed protein product [Camellia sinensis]